MASVRPAAVAGSFYPGGAQTLRSMVERLLYAAPARVPPPKAVIAPHAGYIYSGSVAASAYAPWRGLHGQVRRVILLGPSHHVPLRGLALSSATHFVTPMGKIELDLAAIEALKKLPQVQVLDSAHVQEHSLEVQLPFLQVVLGEFKLVPLAVGQAGAAETAEVLAMFWEDEGTRIVISSDLSHYHSYEEAESLDGRTAAAIEALDYRALGPQEACGCYPIQGLLRLAQERGASVTPLDRCNSGDTAGDRRRVVGYGAWAVT